MALVENLIKGKAGKGKLECLITPLQKLYPLEISSRDYLKTFRNDESETSESAELKDNGKKIRFEKDCGKRSHSGRTAAKDALWKSKLMLDP